MIVASVLLAFVVYVIFSYLFKKSDSRKFPPGPPGVPIFGNSLSLKPKSRHVTLCNFGKQYRDVFTVKLFSRHVVVLNSYKAIKEALVDHGNSFILRPKVPGNALLKKDKGIIMSDGSHWQDHRRFALKTLRDFGFAKTISVNAIHIELQELIDNLIKQSGRPLETKMPFARMTTNVISRMVFGQRLSEDETECMELLDRITFSIQAANSLKYNFLNAFPMLGYIPFFTYLYNKLNYRNRCVHVVFEFMDKQIQKHFQTIGEITEPRDFTDALILHKMALDKEGGGHTFNEESIRLDMYDLFLAGTDTTSVTLSWAMLLMSIHPEIQDKTRSEIHDVLGSESFPTMQEKLKLNYTLAVIDEVSRYSTIVPSSVPHRTTQDVTICGKLIPKDTMIMPNIYSVHCEPGLWKYPKSFNPENFLDENGNYKASEHLIQFSLGKRACLGESLAKMEVFIFFVGIMQKFRVSLADRENVNLETLLEGVSSTVRHLGHHSIVFKEDF